MWFWAVWAVCLVAVVVLVLLNVPIWVSSIAMLVWLYYYTRWMIQFVHMIIADLT